MRKHGFTLVELMMVCAVSSLVIGAVFVMSQAGTQAWVRTDAQLTSLTEAQQALDRLSEDLRAASQNPVPTCAGGQLTMTVGGVPITYSVVNTNLTRTQNATAQVVASGVTALTPTCSQNLVSVTLTAQVGTRYGPLTQTLQSQVWVRTPS